MFWYQRYFNVFFTDKTLFIIKTNVEAQQVVKKYSRPLEETCVNCATVRPHAAPGKHDCKAWNHWAPLSAIHALPQRRVKGKKRQKKICTFIIENEGYVTRKEKKRKENLSCGKHGNRQSSGLRRFSAQFESVTNGFDLPNERLRLHRWARGRSYEKPPGLLLPPLCCVALPRVAPATSKTRLLFVLCSLSWDKQFNYQTKKEESQRKAGPTSLPARKLRLCRVSLHERQQPLPLSGSLRSASSGPRGRFRHRNTIHR